DRARYGAAVQQPGVGPDRVAAPRPEPYRERNLPPVVAAWSLSGSVTQKLPIGAVTSPHAVRVQRPLGRMSRRPTRWHALLALAGQRRPAVDTRTATGWHRRYDDGQTVEIDFPGKTAVPVPFAVGRL